MTGVGHQLFPLQVLGKEFFAEGDRCVLIGLVQTVCQPDVLRAFDDEGRGLVVELVDVGLKPAVLGLLEQKSEGVVLAVGAQPDEVRVHILLKQERDAHLLAPILQDVEQLLASNAYKTMTA